MASLTLQRPLRLLRARWGDAPIALGALLFSAAAMASVVHFAPSIDAGRAKRSPLAASIAPPPMPEMTVQPIAPDKAIELNQELPLTAAAGPAAAPFVLGAVDHSARDAALNCLAQAIYYEAGNESEEGRRAVAQVVLNRVRHPAFPASVCGVVYQGSTRPTGCQFTFTCDGSLARGPDKAGWEAARRIAAAALQGSVYPGVGDATHYHANYVVPTWSSTLARTDVVGAHLFYRWKGGWGQPAAFVQRYSGHELSVDLLRRAALSAHASYVAAGTPTAGHAAPPLAMARAEGLPVTQAPGGRVSLHFTPQARAAVEAALAKPRVATPADAALGSAMEAGAPSSDQKPLGS